MVMTDTLYPSVLTLLTSILVAVPVQLGRSEEVVSNRQGRTLRGHSPSPSPSPSDVAFILTPQVLQVATTP